MARPATRALKCLHCATEQEVDANTIRIICGECCLAGKRFPEDEQTAFPQFDPAQPSEDIL